MSFDDVLGDYIPLVDPIPLPTTDFLPSSNALALYDRIGRKQSTPSIQDPVLFDIVDEDKMDADVEANDNEGNNDGATEAILEEGATIKRHRSKQPVVPVIDIQSDSSDDDLSIVCSVPGSSVQRTRGKFRPRVHSIANTGKEGAGRCWCSRFAISGGQFH